ncbi:MAG: hypothetical protein HS103_06325 [Anaerolineales bacterium]|nr:hypothetical protein [Anaerolineales bacterium]
MIAAGLLTNVRRDQNRASGTLIIRSQAAPTEDDPNPEPRVSKVRVTERLGSKKELYLPALEGHVVEVQALDVYANPIPPAQGSQPPSADGTIGAGLELPVLLIKDMCVPADPENAFGFMRFTFMGNVGQKPEWSDEYKVSNFIQSITR